jgi:hypothetical protein
MMRLALACDSDFTNGTRTTKRPVFSGRFDQEDLIVEVLQFSVLVLAGSRSPQAACFAPSFYDDVKVSGRRQRRIDLGCCSPIARSIDLD